VSQAGRGVTRWVYQGVWGVLARWFRVPAEPPAAPGGGDARTVRAFQPAPGFLRYLKLQFWVALAAVDLAIVVGLLVLLRANTAVGLWVAPLALAVAVVPLLGFVLMPETDDGRLDVDVALPVGTPVETTMEVVQRMEATAIATLPPTAVDHVITTAGPEAWWRPVSGNEGRIQLLLQPASRRGISSADAAASLRRALADTPGADIQVRESSSNVLLRLLRGGGDRLAVEVRGHDLATAERLGRRVRDLMAGVPGVADPKVDREEGKLERTVHVDRLRLAELGLGGADVADAVEHYVLGEIAGRYREAGNEFDIRVLLPELARADVEQLAGLPIVTRDGRRVALGAVARIAERRGPASISRENQQRILRVNAGLEDRPQGDVVADLQQPLAALEVPAGFSVAVGGEFVEQRQIFGDLAVGVLLAIFLVYTVLAVQFESLLHPLVIMTAVPFALIGVVLSLSLTGTTFNMNSFLGTIVLVGIVVNNAIVLVDYINLMRRERGMTLAEAVVHGGGRRLRPILMTTLTTVLGMMPLALGLGEGSELQAPLARVVVGGLSTSTLITLFFVPALYLLIERRRERAAVAAAAAESPEAPLVAVPGERIARVR
jgi:HAE1 family hydrophobic/amphiphilic exporter-1